MAEYVVLLRGINVGGRNKVPMAQLRACLEDAGFEDVRTYIASGNVLLRSRLGKRALEQAVEDRVEECFDLDSGRVRALALTRSRLRGVVEQRPSGFGDEPDTYHSDAIFLIDITPARAMRVFDPREDVDAVWPGRGVVYSQRLSAERTKSRLGRIVGTPEYASMTIRSWRTTCTLLELMGG
jgi:uncharacterized protein (DUF1697 family)